MTARKVVFTPEAEAQLLELFRYIAAVESQEVAARYVEAIITHCEGLGTFPERGTRRDDVRPGLRVTHCRKRAIIAFAVEAEQVAILGVFYGGQDYEAAMGTGAGDIPQP